MTNFLRISQPTFNAGRVFAYWKYTRHVKFYELKASEDPCQKGLPNLTLGALFGLIAALTWLLIPASVKAVCGRLDPDISVGLKGFSAFAGPFIGSLNTLQAALEIWHYIPC